MPLETGQIIDGKYRVLRLLGEGGMGAVFEGENIRIGRRVAIKVLHAHVAQMPEFAERFEKEARAAARIGSKFVCDVFDLGDLPGGDRYIVMEYLDGLSLEARMEERVRMTPQEIAPIAWELLDGLATMHAAGVIHRDLKPANVFITRVNSGRGEEVRILDFGVAKIQPFPGEVASMTQTGAMMGTPLYMSPEQARGARDVDARSDLYSVSVIFYRALTGQLPFAATSLNELLFKIVLEDPPPIMQVVPDMDEAFAAIIQRGMVRDAENRIPSARAYQELIAAWGRTQGRTSMRFEVPGSDSGIPAAVSFMPTFTGPQQMPDEVEAFARAQNMKSPAGVMGVAAPNTPAGTPVVWSGGATRESGPPVLPSPPPPAPSPSAAPETTAATAKKKSMMPFVGAAALFAIVGIVAAVMTKHGDKHVTAEPPATVTATVAATEPKPTPTAAVTQAVETTAATAATQTAADPAPAGDVPPTAAGQNPVVMARRGDPAVKPKGSAEPPPVVPVVTAVPAASTTPAAAASNHGRKYRTNID